MEDKEHLEKLIQDFNNAKLIKGEFRVNPDNLLQHFVLLEDFEEDCTVNIIKK